MEEWERGVRMTPHPSGSPWSARRPQTRTRAGRERPIPSIIINAPSSAIMGIELAVRGKRVRVVLRAASSARTSGVAPPVGLLPLDAT